MSSENVLKYSEKQPPLAVLLAVDLAKFSTSLTPSPGSEKEV